LINKFLTDALKDDPKPEAIKFNIIFILKPKLSKNVAIKRFWLMVEFD